MAQSTLRRVRDLSADIGWREFLKIAPQWLVCRRYLALAADLEGLVLDRPSRPELRVTGLEPADVAALCALEPVMTREEVARRLAAGQRCTLGWWGRELAHVRWDSPAPVHLPFLERVLQPGPGDEIVVGIYTAPAFRGHGIAGAVMVDTARRARDAGARRWVWLAAWWNRRSLALADQFASRVEGTVGYWKLGPWRRYFASGRIRLGPDGTIRFDDGAPSATRRVDARC